MNVIDRIVGFVSPKAAFNRARYRAATNLVRSYEAAATNLARSYEAAATGRRTSGWRSRNTSANTEIELSLARLRDRSRELVRNNPYAKAAMEVITTNVIGDGIRPAPAQASRRQVERAKALWAEWADTTACDLEGQETLYGLQRLALRAIAESGEVLIRRRKINDRKLPVPIKIQVLEADFLDINKSDRALPNGGRIIQGVEFDKAGRRVAYWLFNEHPGDGWATLSNRVPADEVLHIYKKDRPGQVRGVPVGVSAMLRLKDFDDYEDAQLVRQKIAACFVAFIAGDPGFVSEQKADVTEKFEPGAIQRLAPGETVTIATPPPVIGYDEYSRNILRAIAKGFGVTYEALTGDLSNVNFSSARMGWLEFHRAVGEWQEHIMIPKFCAPVWQWFNEAAVLAGSLRAPVSATWTAPRREMIDPVKETKGIIEAIRGGLLPWEEAVRQMGYDPDTVIAQIVANFETFQKAGLMLTCDPRYDANRPPVQGEGSGDGDGDGQAANDSDDDGNNSQN